MRIDFRQGLLRYQTDTAGNPTFLKRSGSNIDLIVSPDPTLVAFADGTEDYLQEERQTIPAAWTGPYNPTLNYWLYIDVDTQTGVRSFGETTLEPFVGFRPPPNPAEDQHWFDRSENTQKVRRSNRWVRVVRVFVARLASGTVLQPYSIGSQVGLWSPVDAGFIVFDENDNPVKLEGPLRQQRFLTTASPLASQFSGAANFFLEGLITTGTAVENIPAWAAVAIVGPNQIGLASNSDPSRPAIGVINEDAVPGEVVRIITDGFQRSSLLSFPNVDAGSPLFVGVTGLLTPVPPQQFSIQEVARVINANTIFVNVRPLIKFQG